MNWHQLVNDAASCTSHRVRLNRFFSDVNTLNHDVLSIYTLLDDTTLALIFTGQDDNFVAFSNLIHNDSLQNFRRERNNFHKALGTQFARDRPKNTRADRL